MNERRNVKYFVLFAFEILLPIPYLCAKFNRLIYLYN